MLADDLPGVTVAGTLRPGKKAGETDLGLQFSDEAAYVASITRDNTGSLSTGMRRWSANVTVNSPLGIGDLFTASTIKTRGSVYGQAGYSIPIGGDGWRVGANVSRMRYKLISTELESLNAFGTSETSALTLSYPLVRTQDKNLTLKFGVENKHFVNDASEAVQSNYGVRNVSLDVSGSLFDKIGGGGANSASIVWNEGRLSLGDLDTGEDDTLRGSFKKVTYALSRQQALNDSTSVLLSLTGQAAYRVMDSSEQFFLGGTSGVRAYPSSEGSGSEGWVANVEIRKILPYSLLLTGFYDHGQVDNFAGSRDYRMHGGGVSLAWQSDFGLNVKGTVARRMDENPNPVTGGQDQDGSLVRDRIWLSSTYSF